MIFRTLNKENAGLIAELFSTDLPDGWKQNLIEDAFDTGRFYALGVFNEQEMVGVITFDISFETADLEDIVVKKQLRNKGVATELLERAIMRLKACRVEKVFLEVRKSNQTAISFYLKNGFNKISERKNYYSDGEDALIMVKELEQ